MVLHVHGRLRSLLSLRVHSDLRKPMTSKLPQATKGAQLFSPEEKRTPLPCHSGMNTSLDVRATPGLKPLQHVRIKMAFSISSKVLHQFIPSPITPHQVPRIFFLLHFIDLNFFLFFFFFLNAFFLLAGHMALGCQARYTTAAR